MKKRLSVIIIISLVCVIGVALAHTHEWGVWKTTKQPTCQEEGRQVRSCTLEDCSSHERRNVAKVPHDFAAATCTAPKTCKFNCGTTSGSALGHNYRAPTCVAPETCSRCSATRGGLGEHKFAPATCLKPSTCPVCGISIGSLGGHTYRPATCMDPRTCTLCGATTGKALGHVWDGNVCTRCRMSYALKYDPTEES